MSSEEAQKDTYPKIIYEKIRYDDDGTFVDGERLVVTEDKPVDPTVEKQRFVTYEYADKLDYMGQPVWHAKTEDFSFSLAICTPVTEFGSLAFKQRIADYELFKMMRAIYVEAGVEK